MKSVRFTLAISAERYLAYYRGSARNVVVRAHDGRVVRFPAETLRAFVTHDGIHGEFELRYDRDNKLLGMERVR